MPDLAGKSLGPRERQILAMLADGYEEPAIADELCISRSTVKTWKAKLFEKLGAHNGAQAVHLAYRRGDLWPEEFAGVLEEAALIRQGREMGYRIALVRVDGAERCVNCTDAACAGCWGADTAYGDDWRPS